MNVALPEQIITDKVFRVRNVFRLSSSHNSTLTSTGSPSAASPAPPVAYFAPGYLLLIPTSCHVIPEARNLPVRLLKNNLDQEKFSELIHQS